MPYHVYMLASRRNGTLYIGVTGDLVRRVHQHRNGAVEEFTKRYGVHDRVWFEQTHDVRAAIQREHTMKHWKRAWKVALIEKGNPTWRDPYGDIVG